MRWLFPPAFSAYRETPATKSISLIRCRFREKVTKPMRWWRISFWSSKYAVIRASIYGCISALKASRGKRGSGEGCISARRWTLDAGRWTLDAGRWTLDAGRWTLDAGRWTLDAGRFLASPISRQAQRALFLQASGTKLHH